MTKHTREIEGKYLTFSLGWEEYGIPIQKIREILEPMEIQRVPSAVSFIRGVAEIRGKNIPVLDLKNRLGLEEKESGKAGCVLLVMVQGWNGPALVGLLVDSIRQVRQVGSADWEPLPATEREPRFEFLTGLVQGEDRVVLLLDLDRVAFDEAVDEARAWGLFQKGISVA